MVSKFDELELNKLENQVDNGGGGAWEYLCLVRKLKVRRSDKVLKHGLSILNDPNKRSNLGGDGEFGILFLFYPSFSNRFPNREGVRNYESLKVKFSHRLKTNTI